ncbi:MAG: hypothetical protein PF448_06250 [Bacteroidales bacterium]|jgi:hypothetical protein|nr:hypothetical protein [Bacteroidales bacterium]
MDGLIQTGTAAIGCRKKWVSHEQINDLFGEVSKTTLADFRRNRRVTFAKHPFKRDYIYSLEEIEGIINSTVVERSITHQ